MKTFYNKYLAEVTARLIEKTFDVTAYKTTLRADKETGLLDFEVCTVRGEKNNTYKGYIGSVGAIKVTYINDTYLEDNYISLT